VVFEGDGSGGWLEVEGVDRKGACPFPVQLGGLGSVVSCPSGVWGRAPAENEFLLISCCFLSSGAGILAILDA